MTLTQLEYVVALDKYRNFHRAAEACHVTQPTLSAQLQKLEEQLGEILFNRKSNPIEPTEVGRRVIQQAKRVLSEAAVIQELTHLDTGELRGTLRVGVIPTISTYLLPLFLESMFDSHPNLNLEISELTTPDCLAALDREDIDVAILATKEDRKKYFQQRVFEEEMLLYVNSDHPLAQEQKIIPTDLNSNDLWILEEGHCLRDEVLKVCRIRSMSKKRPKNLMYKVGSLESLRYLVQESHGYTLLPYLATLKLSPKEKRNLRHFTSHPYREIIFTKNRHNLKARAIEALKEEVVRCLPKTASEIKI